MKSHLGRYCKKLDAEFFFEGKTVGETPKV